MRRIKAFWIIIITILSTLLNTEQNFLTQNNYCLFAQSHNHSIFNQKFSNSYPSTGDTLTEWMSWNGHFGEQIEQIAFHPSGQYFASNTWNEIVFWDASTGERLKTMKNYSYFCFSPDGNHIVTRGYYPNPSNIFISNLITGDKKELQIENIQKIAFSLNTSKFAMMGYFYQSYIYIYDMNTGVTKKINMDQYVDDINNIAFSPDGKYLAVLDRDKIVIWDVDQDSVHATLQKRGNEFFDGSHLNYSPDGNIILCISVATADKVRRVKMWNTKTNQEIGTLYLGRKGIISLSFSPDSRLMVASISDGELKYWNVSTFQETKKNVLSQNHVVLFGLSPDWTKIAFSRIDNNLHKINLWYFENETKILEFEGHKKERVKALAVSNSNKVFATAGYEIKLWDIENGSLIKTIYGHEGEIYSLAFHPTEPILASASRNRNRTIKLWNIMTGEMLVAMDLWSQFYECALIISFTPDGSKIIAEATNYYNSYLTLWDSKTGSFIKMLTHDEGISDFDISFDGKYAAVSLINDNWNSYFQVINLSTYDIVKNFESSVKSHNATRIEFTKDTSKLIIKQGDYLKFLDLNTESVIDSVYNPYSSLLSMNLSPDGELLFTSGSYGTISLLNAKTLELIDSLKLDDGSVLTTEFTADGSKVATVGYGENQVRIFKITKNSGIRNSTQSSIINDYHIYPNPFQTETTLQFHLPTISKASLVIYDILGRELINKELGYFYPGIHAVNFNFNNLPSGVYFYRLRTSIGTNKVKKMILLR